jgi:hypothetical protein
MKRLLLLVLVLVFVLPFSATAQRSKWLKKQNVRVATTLNYYPAVEPFTFFSEFSREEDRRLILSYREPNAGTFTIEEGTITEYESNTTILSPSQLISIGGSIQFVNKESIFQELALTKFSFSKSSFLNEVYVIDDMGYPQFAYVIGAEERTGAFAFRYELGKYFGDPRYDILRFGIAVSVEPSLYTYKRTPYDSGGFPFRGRIFALETSLVPVAAIRFSKKVSLDLKVIPNIMVASFGSIKVENPILTKDQQVGTRNFEAPALSMAYSILLRYQIQEAKRSRRRNP